MESTIIEKKKIVRAKCSKATKQPEIEKTPESELMSVEEYFDMVWNRYLEKYEKLQD